MKYLILSVFVVSFMACKTNKTNEFEKFYKQYKSGINVSDKIFDIKTSINFGSSLLYILDDFLIVNEVPQKNEKGIHLFNSHSFEYIRSTGVVGRGPGEIGNTGRLGIDKKNKIILAPDYDKSILYKFQLDSLLINFEYKPTSKVDLDRHLFIESFGFLSDSIVLGKAWQIQSRSSFITTMAKFNLNTGTVEKFGYEHPKTVGKKSSSSFALSVEKGIYVNCYYSLDLMTICDINGNLKYNVYGPGWNIDDGIEKAYYFGVEIIGDMIIASYIGGPADFNDGIISRGAAPNKFLCFDLNGNYLNTIEVGYDFERFCIDEKNKRVIAYFLTRIEPLGYFNFPF